MFTTEATHVCVHACKSAGVALAFLRGRLAFCCTTATLHMVRPSAIVSGRWRSRRSSPHRDRHGRTPTSSASSARSAANVSITSSSSMSVTCAACCRRMFSIGTEAGHISHSARTVRNPAYTATLRRHRCRLPPGWRSAPSLPASRSLNRLRRPNLYRRRTAGRRRDPQLRRSNASALKTHAGSPRRKRAARSSITEHHQPWPSSAIRFHGRMAI